ncbi:MAG: hypothetical protein CVT48_03330 [Thermoplasmata archaeon HGW-Thermoplasmata-1]|nr:MAG: hypothetical protein CVT48_03330 [Thermoplasmata archaeon HGW-Thermoplasmata-1]
MDRKRIKKGTFLAVFVAGLIIFAYAIVLMAEPARPGTISSELAEGLGWEKTISDEVHAPIGMMSAARTYQYKGTERLFGTVTVLTYSFPVPKYIASTGGNTVSRESTVWNTMSAYNMEFGPITKETEMLAGHKAVVYYYNFTTVTPLELGLVNEATGKFIVASLSSDGAVFKETSNVVYGFVLTSSSIKGTGGTVIYSTGEDLSTYNQLYELVHDGFVVER